jgi:hypothetical protein
MSSTVPNADDLVTAVRATIPAAHFVPPVVGESFSPARDQEKSCLQDYAFIEGFAFVIRSRDSRPVSGIARSIPLSTGDRRPVTSGRSQRSSGRRRGATTVIFRSWHVL